jgi:hypothetical protein
MLIARQKKSENIAEFVLYMFQMEDLMRMFGFNLDIFMEQYVSKSIPNKEFEGQYRKWFSDIIDEMKSNGLEKEGHIDEVKEVLLELIYLHNTLVTVLKDEKYMTLCNNSKDFLEEFREKSKMKDRHDIEVILHAMYMKLQLTIRKQDTSEETETALDHMRIQLAYISREYKRMHSGEWNFLQN